MGQREKEGLVKAGEFARFEPSEKRAEGEINRAEKEYTVSPAQRAVLGISLREAR